MKNNIDYKKHWNKIYSQGELNKLGWYEKSPKPSLELIKKCNLNKDAMILDVGSGVTTLIGKLLESGYKNIVATDISEVALIKAKDNLDTDNDESVKWIVDDITNPEHLTEFETVDLWHDRTVLHFLTEENQRNGYLSTLKRLVNVGGYVIIVVFSLEGAKKCSGLDVINYDHTIISQFVGDEFILLDHFPHLYVHPSGSKKPYAYTLFKRIPRQSKEKEKKID